MSRDKPRHCQPILVVGLSPAWQRTLHFHSVKLGAVNRACRVTEFASGKGVNVARVIGTLGTAVRLITVAGGYHGEQLCSALKSEGLDGGLIYVAAPTRLCQTLIAGDATTELVEECAPLTRLEARYVTQSFDGQIKRARLLALTGSVPGGCGDAFYARLAETAARRGVPVLIDAQGAQLMNAVKMQPWAVRLTREELAVAAGVPARGDHATRMAAQRLLALGARWVVVSDGPRAVDAFALCDSFRIRPPRVVVQNPIGSGDAMLAGMAHGLVRGWSMRRAVALGVACGAANAMTPLPGVVRTRDVKQLARTVCISER